MIGKKWGVFRLRFRDDLCLVMRFQSEDKGPRGECCEKSSGIRVGNTVQKQGSSVLYQRFKFTEPILR